MALVRNMMKSLFRYRAFRGAFAGMVATGIMSIVIAAGHRTGLLKTPPPKQITKRAARKMGIKTHQIPEPAIDLAWITAHGGYGMGAGVVYTCTGRLLPANNVVAGLMYGGMIWAISYLGLMPAAQLYPWPEDDSTSRTLVMVAAHGVYGTTLAQVESRTRIS